MPETVEEYVARTRLEQGFPVRIEDDRALRVLARLLPDPKAWAA